MKILITGGHLTPALAVIEKLKLNNYEIYYVGRKLTFEGDGAISLEHKTINDLGIPFFEIRTGRLQRRLSKYTLPSLIKMPGGFLQAYKILSKVKPDVVLTFGSYVSVPVGIIANLMKIPLVIHEQILGAGFSNKMLSKFATKICISWKDSNKYFPANKTVLTGNPLRKEILDNTNEVLDNDLIYISGGSSGSHEINLLVESVIEKLLKDFKVIHQTGDSQKYKDYDRLKNLQLKLNKNFSKNYTLVKFLNPNEAAKTIAKAKFVIGRSGINTITELIYFNKPAILIPLRLTKNSEQFKNAQFLTINGLSEFYLGENLAPEIFYEKIIEFRNNIKNYKLKFKLLEDKPAEKIIDVLNDVYKKKTS